MYPNLLRALMQAFTAAVLKNVKINCDESQRNDESSQARVSVLNKIIYFDQLKRASRWKNGFGPAAKRL